MQWKRTGSSSGSSTSSPRLTSPDLEGGHGLGPPLGAGGLPHQVVLDHGGAVGRSHLSEDHHLGGVFRVVPQVRRHRGQQDQVGEGQVGQDPPGAQQSLEVTQLHIVEIGALEGQLGRSGHPQPPSGRIDRDQVGSAATVGLQPADAGSVQQVPQVVGPIGHIGKGVGVRGRGQRDPLFHEPLEQRRRRVLLTHRLPPPRRGQLGSHPRAHRGLGDPVVELVGHRRHPPGHLDQVGVGEDITGPRGSQLLHGPGVLVPHRVDVAHVPLRHDQGVVEDVEAPRPQPVHRPQQHVEGVAGQQPGHLIHPVLVVVDLEAQDHREALGLDRLDHLHVGVEVHPGVVVPVGGHAGPQGLAGEVVPEPSHQVAGLGEAEQVLGQGDFGHPGLDGALAVGRHLFHRGLGVTLRVGPQMEVVVEHVCPVPGPFSRPGG